MQNFKLRQFVLLTQAIIAFAAPVLVPATIVVVGLLTNSLTATLLAGPIALATGLPGRHP